jgi:CHAD domain-containing protein
MRAFLPLAQLSVNDSCLRRVDTEGKTRIRIHVENIRLNTAADQSRPLQKRIRLEPLRGYEKTARKAVKLLETDYRLTASCDELYNLALERAGKQPGDYSSKLSIVFEHDMRADAAVRRVLLVLLHSMQVNEPGTIRDLDSEFLHDFRVAVRRTRSALGELKWVFPPATRARFRREFAWLGALTSSVRDLDVYLLKFDRYQASIPKDLRDDLEPLRQFLQYKQHKQQAGDLARELQGRRYRRLKQQWQRYLESPLAKRPVAKDAARPIGVVASHRIWRMYRRVLKEGRAISPESPPPDLHELRKSCKKLRYLMEFFQSLYPRDAIRAAIKELKQLQDNLGDFQDLDVQINAFDHFILEMRRRGEYSDATGKAMEALLDALRLEMQAVRADFESRFQRFTRRDNRQRFKKLFRD